MLEINIFIGNSFGLNNIQKMQGLAKIASNSPYIGIIIVRNFTVTMNVAPIILVPVLKIRKKKSDYSQRGVPSDHSYY